ncbi:hypothetical protein HY251_21270 [bacterium]|nr:hypothetical protein [bacterium]
MDHRRYVLLLGAVSLALLVSIPALNGLVDPYDYRVALGWSERREFDPVNEALGYAPDPSGERAGKAYNIRRYQPDAVVFGSSNVWVGIDPSHEGWRGRGLRAYNFGIAGSSIYEVEEFFQHAHRLRPMKQAVIGLDLYMFNANRTHFQEPLADLGLAHRPGERSRLLLSMGKHLVSNDYTVLSLERLCRWPRSFTAEDGLLAVARRFAPVLPRLEAREPIVTAEEFRSRLLAMEHEVVRALLLERNRPFGFEDQEGRSSVDCLARVLESARKGGIDVRLFIPPVHARTWELVRLAGQWPVFEEWLRGLVALLEAEARAHADKPPVPLWTFGCYTETTTEPVPSGPGNAAFSRYVDSIHFKKELGDLVLDRILDVSSSDRGAPPDFGTKLTPANVEAFIAETRRAQEEYVRAHASDAAEQQEIVSRVREGK